MKKKEFIIPTEITASGIREEHKIEETTVEDIDVSGLLGTMKFSRETYNINLENDITNSVLVRSDMYVAKYNIVPNVLYIHASHDDKLDWDKVKHMKIYYHRNEPHKIGLMYI